MESTVALWNANITGNEKDYKKLMDLELEFNKSNQNRADHFSPDKFTPFTQNVFTNEQDFELLSKLKRSGVITDTMLIRQITVLYQSFMGPQVESDRYRALRQTESRLIQSFSRTEFEADGKKYAGNQLDSLRKASINSSQLKAIYLTYRQKGKQLSADIIQMVKMRNVFAKRFGYTNYYQLALETKDQTPEKIKQLLDDIELKTNEQFVDAKRMIDKVLAKKFNISVTELRPWHYNDERTSYLPAKFSEKMDSLYRKSDPIKLASAFFDGIGLPVQDVIERSDLKYHAGKSSVTGIFNIDFKNDLRMLSTIDNNQDGMKKIMHLCGHASHFKGISEDIPYLLKDPNPVIAEGLAGFFEKMASNNLWLQSEFTMDSATTRNYGLLCQHFFQVDRLFRFRKFLVIAVFEREIYRDPDQNLGDLWYRLNEKYLGIKPPDIRDSDDWATSKYVTSFSCNVHNFVLADLFTSQLHHYIEKNILNKTGKTGYQNNKAIGVFLQKNLYQYGDLVPWEQLIEKATGEPLNPLYFANYLLGKEENNRKK
jgi:peptidyl-dipeptidase A